MAVAPDPNKANPGSEDPDRPHLSQQLGETVAAARRFAGDLVELFGLEARLAGLSAAKVLALALVAAFTIIAAWLFLQGALIAWIHQLGLNLGLAFLLFSAINIAATAGLGYAAVRSSRSMTFAATRQVLRKEPLQYDERTEATDRP